jgi:hypothetical protein
MPDDAPSPLRFVWTSRAAAGHYKVQLGRVLQVKETINRRGIMKTETPDYYTATIMVEIDGERRKAQVEVFDIIEAFGLYEDAYLCQALQYILRYKNREADVAKARNFLDRWIQLYTGELDCEQ